MCRSDIGRAQRGSLLPRLRDLIADAGAFAQVRLRRGAPARMTAEERLLGSPTVRVDGTDVEPGASDRCDFGLKCRLYLTADGQRGAPPSAWVTASLEAAAQRPARDQPAGETGG